MFAALGAINGDLWARIYAGSAPELDPFRDESGTAKGLVFHTDFTDGDFSGTVEGTGSWTGSVAVDGTFFMLEQTSEAWAEIWDMQVGWAGVRWSDLRLEGDFYWKLRADVAVDGSFTYHSRVDGQLTARGGAAGAGALDYSTTAVLGGGRYQVFVTGTVGGHDVTSEWDATDAFGF